MQQSDIAQRVLSIRAEEVSLFAAGGTGSRDFRRDYCSFNLDLGICCVLGFIWESGSGDFGGNDLWS